MDTFTTIQMIFYVLASIVTVAVGVLLCIAIYYLIAILRDTRDVADDVRHTYHKTKERIKKVVNLLSKKKK